MYLELYLFILLLLFIWRGSHAFDFRLILGERGGSCDCFVPLYASSSSSFFIRLFVMYQVTRRLPKAHSLELQFQPQSQARHGHDQCYRQYSSRTEHRRTIFVPRGVRDWSSLPQETDQDPTHDTFIVKPPHLNKPSPSPPPPIRPTRSFLINFLPVDLECTKEEGRRWKKKEVTSMLLDFVFVRVFFFFFPFYNLFFLGGGGMRGGGWYGRDSFVH